MEELDIAPEGVEPAEEDDGDGAELLAAAEPFLLDALKLVIELCRIRDMRIEGRDLGEVDDAMGVWRTMRLAFWDDVQEASAAGEFIPLAVLADRLGLTEQEIDLLLVALAPLIDSEARDVLLGPKRRGYRHVTDDVALSVLFHTAEERYSGRALLSPAGGLVRNGLVELVPLGPELSAQAYELRVTQAFANFVLGRPLVSGPIAHYCELCRPLHHWDAVVLPREDKERMWAVVAGTPAVQANLDKWGYGSVMPRARGVVLLFAGPPGTGKSMFAHALAHRLERQVLAIHTSRLLASSESIRPILQEAFRVASLTGAVVLMDDCETLLDQRDASFLALLESLSQHQGVLIMTTNNAPSIDFAMARRIQLRLDFEAPNPLLREFIWEVHLPPEAPLKEDIDVRTLAQAYEFTGAQIRNTVLVALAQMGMKKETTLGMVTLREAAETQLQARLGELAVKSHTAFGLERLVLPELEMKKIREILSACKHREFVLSTWGFGDSLTKGRGLCILFDGPPGTGKTFSAELIAHDLRLPLYRVHIPNVVSKWVGETERNISKIFSRARSARAVLLFDEADSLFGRRNQNAQSSNDRYANMEVNLLLQEIEAYDGITFLTTNLFGNLDEALQRRIQFRVTFPFPEAEQRANIWEVLTPKAAPLADDVNFAALGKRFELAGGHIKNALLRAAYRARDEGQEIRQRHLSQAAVAECQAQGKIVRALPTDMLPTNTLPTDTLPTDIAPDA